MQKIIGIDIDEVLSETIEELLENNNYKIGNITVSKDDLKHYYLYKNRHLNFSSKEEGDKFFAKVFINDKEKLNIKCVPGAKEKLEILKNKGYILKVITGRTDELEIYTKNWINKNFKGIFDSIHFANHVNYGEKNGIRREKSEICKELGINIFVEDYFEYALELAENGIFTFLIEKPWNKDIKTKHKNIKRVKSWEEINI